MDYDKDGDSEDVRRGPSARAGLGSALAGLALGLNRTSRHGAGHRSRLRHRALFQIDGGAFSIQVDRR